MQLNSRYSLCENEQKVYRSSDLAFTRLVIGIVGIALEKKGSELRRVRWQLGNASRLSCSKFT